MKEQEFRRQIENTYQELLSGKKLEAIKSNLKAIGVSNRKANEILKGAEDLVTSRYGQGIMNHLEKGTLDDNMKTYEIINSEVFQKIKNKQLGYLIYNAEVQVKIKVRENLSNEEIVNVVGTKFITKDQIVKMANNERNDIVKKIKAEKFSYLIIGFLSLLMGVALILFSIKNAGGRLKIGALPIILGISMIGKGLSMKTDLFD